MLRLSEILRDAYTDTDCSAAHSLSFRLEYEAGRYWVPCEGFAEWSEIYYDADYDPYNGDPRTLTVPEKIVAYIFWAQKLVFVQAAYYAKMCADAKGFGFTFLPFSSFAEKFYCDETDVFPFLEITWLDDDFLNDDTAEFDFDTFRKIDAGVKYLNPKHVSVQEIMEYLTTPEIHDRIRRQRGEYISFETGEQP